MMKVEFTEWPKTTRLFRDIVVTEKLDGTNSAIRLERMDQVSNRLECLGAPNHPIAVVNGIGIWAQSRSRLLTITDDNFGFARWILDNAEELTTLFDTGIHFGEWWGRGIQRGYGTDHKRFSLFNTFAHQGIDDRTDLPIYCVPVLYEGVFDQAKIEEILTDLRENGSVAVPGFMKPEGICVFHTQSRIVQKVTLDKNDKGKWES